MQQSVEPYIPSNRSNLYNHISHLIADEQHGFIRNRSCVTQLLSVFHAIGKSLDKNIQTDILYLDFAKAFDSVDHDILLAKLKTYGVNGNLFNWFTDYLHGRVQRVVVDGVASDWATVTSGVPQGSLLGPILFVIFINDFPNVVSDASQTALYADDSKLYKSISCLGSCESLQQSLDHLSMWSHNNNISFNASKCKVLTVTRKSNPLCFDYYLGNTTLVNVRKEKDLGCIITNHLTWDQQVLVVVCKANKMLGLLRRTCPLLTNTKVRRSLYLSLVKCHLDYATQVWSPALTSLKIKIENVQRRATRWILKQRKGEQSYKERLVTLKLLPLCYDREVKDLVFFYKAMHGYINLDVNNFVSFVAHGRTRLSETRTLKTPSCRTSTFQGSYFNRIVKLWNSIMVTSNSRNFSSLSMFKTLAKNIFSSELNRTFDVDMTCTWSLSW